jgi:multiple sugar transport system substrate-binding protein
MAGRIELTGITWDHSRALPPLVAAAQRYGELHPGVHIRWEKRSLHEFGHMPIDQLAGRFDLIVIDHPWAGHCFARGLVLDLRPLLAAGQWEDLAANSVGPSFGSYVYEGKLLAVPVDAATPAPSFRPDLLARRGLAPPRTWKELLALADAGRAVMPGFPADLFLNWTMLVAALGGGPCAGPERVSDRAAGVEAAGMLRRLAEKMPADILGWNPIAVAERMTRTDDFAHCASAYSYNNYCRPSFTDRPLRYGRLPVLDGGTPLRSVVGGTGIALTPRCTQPGAALDFALFAGSAAVQRGVYACAGGQPSRREAWDDAALNALAGGFFSAARHDQENAIVRPRYDGYVPLQEEAGVPLQKVLRGGLDPARAWEEIDAAYRRSLPPGT